MIILTTHQTQSRIQTLRALGMASRRRRIPRQAPIQPLIRDYTQRLLVLVEDTRAAISPLMSELPYVVSRRDSLHLDAGESKRVAEIMRRARESLSLAMRQEKLEQVTQAIATQTADQNKRELGKQIRAATGIDVLIRDPKLADQVQDFVASNVSAIKTIPEQLLGQVEQVVHRGIREGANVKMMTEEIDETFGVGKKRAARIARDQIGSLYGQLNAERQKSIGIKRFIWRTVRDNRVREEHTEREKASDPKLGGTPYSYEDPPDGELPGEPHGCRCHGEPVFSDILEAA